MAETLPILKKPQSTTIERGFRICHLPKDFEQSSVSEADTQAHNLENFQGSYMEQNLCQSHSGSECNNDNPWGCSGIGHMCNNKDTDKVMD